MEIEDGADLRELGSEVVDEIVDVTGIMVAVMLMDDGQRRVGLIIRRATAPAVLLTFGAEATTTLARSLLAQRDALERHG